MNTRERVRMLVDAPAFQRVIIAVILVNAFTLGCETSATLMAGYGWLLHAIDRIALAVFTIEIAARLYAHGWRFFRDPWNCFDAVIVGVSLLPTTGTFGVLRALRVLRVLRLISAVPNMRRVVGALLTAVPGMASIAALLVLILYVGSVIATKLFSEVAPEYFGDLGDSLFTLFQVMTGEAWSEVARSVMDAEPLAWIFFIGYIAVTTFTVLNLFIAVAVSAMESQVSKEREEHDDSAETVQDLLGEVRGLRAELRELRAEVGSAPTARS
ncbi:voltage-gated sodium channel [Saccharopolyspora antimicrobica]|uniref:Voltage-gated sodium channel n=1 Tax=Saccharopolyspora antimicrobica TaxID=455193 RepID=A0A1I4TXQ1_9PSEU|nr:ion transporter [Saccharopolyspora antimicrobica]RKT88581.1 voltage-gated sodium channel [Saccharopolyspora antimicrobica]SFM81397.1 voltage-gated sodium channel [Saccharopolyspora antimicrobica]